MKTLIQFFVLAFTTIIIAQTGITSEEVLLKNDSIMLPGTLSYTKDLKKQPLVIFVHGSGNIDRNGNQAGGIQAKYIKQLADSLNKRDIAFYRYDKRSSTMANAKFLMKNNTTLEFFLEDVNIAINNFKDDSRFSSITLIGHSQGSTIAMLAAQQNKVDKYVSLAGLGRKFGNFIIDEFTKSSTELGEIARKNINEFNVTGAIKSVHPRLAHIFPKQNYIFMKSWMQYDPSEEIKKLNIPILLINGTRDLQVFPLDAEKLHEANPKSELVIIENMNHVLKNVESDQENQYSYSSPKYPLSEKLIESLTAFIKK